MRIRSCFFLLVALVCLTQSAWAIYEDQIGSFNWRRSFIGEIGQAELLETQEIFVVPKDKSGFGLLNLEGEVIYFKELAHERSALVTKAGSCIIF